MVSATALLAGNPRPSDSDIDERNVRQHLPLRHLCPHSRSDQTGRYRVMEVDMSITDNSKVGHAGEPVSNNEPSRRAFLRTGVAAGGGLMLGFHLPFGIDATPAFAAETFAPNAFTRIAPDGKVTLIMPYVEMGQGTYTSIPMLIAEELEVELNQIQLEHAPPDEKLYTNPLLGVQATGNSNAIRGAWMPLRQAGATARTMLIEAAAKRWGVDSSACRAERGSGAASGDWQAPYLCKPGRRRSPDVDP